MSLPSKCPLCGEGRESQAVVTPHVYGWKDQPRHAFFHCESCDVRYQYPGLTPEQESRFYVAEFEGFMAGRAGSAGGWTRAEDHLIANEPTRLRRMKYLESRLPEGGNLLEVGCSSGFMLYPLKEKKIECVGVEPSGVFGEFVRSRGIRVFDSVESLLRDCDGIFDLVIHFFVLEHIADPVSFLRRQLRLLKSGGKIVFEIPNAADPLFTVYDIPAFERFYWSVAHPWYFSEPSLRYLLEQLNQPYEILRDQRYDLSNHMVWARDGKPGGMGRFTGLLGEEMEEAYKQSLIRSGRCDTLVGVIQKVD